MKQEIFDHLNDRLKDCQRRMDELKGYDPLTQKERAILSVKIASLRSRIRYLKSDVQVFLPNYNLQSNQMPQK
jgi:hypothetical protein